MAYCCDTTTSPQLLHYNENMVFSDFLSEWEARDIRDILTIVSGTPPTLLLAFKDD